MKLGVFQLRLHSLSFLAVRILAIYMLILGITRISNLLDFALPAYMLALDVEVQLWKIVLKTRFKRGEGRGEKLDKLKALLPIP